MARSESVEIAPLTARELLTISLGLKPKIPKDLLAPKIRSLAKNKPIFLKRPESSRSKHSSRSSALRRQTGVSPRPSWTPSAAQITAAEILGYSSVDLTKALMVDQVRRDFITVLVRGMPVLLPSNLSGLNQRIESARQARFHQVAGAVKIRKSRMPEKIVVKKPKDHFGLKGALKDPLGLKPIKDKRRLK